MLSCKCWCVLPFKQGVQGLYAELREFVQEPSKDEFSDVCVMLNRIIGSLIKRPYVRVLPFDKLYFDKVQLRMLLNGCIRSKPICKVM